MTTEAIKLVRANRVTVKVDENGNFVAEFYRTHKKISTITNPETGWEKPVDMTKTGERESFRAYVIQNAEIFGIEWKPENLQDESNRRCPKYEGDEQLTSDAIAMITPDINEMVGKCKYGIIFKSTDVERIIPKTKTSKGIPLSGLGIIDGKYEKSGNWAWADVEIAVTMEYKAEEIYYTAMVELVSGQLKKPKLTITAFNEYIKGEIINAGLATADELDPPKESAEPKAEVRQVVITESEGGDLPEILKPEIEVETEVQDTPQTEVVEDSANVENKSGRRRTLGKNK